VGLAAKNTARCPSLLVACCHLSDVKLKKAVFMLLEEEERGCK